MSHTIQHRGTVERVADGRVYVAVEQQSACAGCHAKSLCGTGERMRTIEVETPYAESFAVGESVVVALLKESMAMSSIVWGYVMPLVVLLAVLFTATALGMSEGMAAVSSIAGVVLYYAGLGLMRKRLTKKIKFTIIKE